MSTQIEQLTVNTIRMLSIDAVEKAKSGHPGMPMGAAPMAYAVWAKHMKHNPGNPDWFNRDRFILSAGHGSALLYSLLHLFGYGLSIEEVKSFRQWGSITPGHPEANHGTPGVEATTGPLGQGISNAVGMAMAEAHLAARYNRDGFSVVDHYTYTICSDGDLMEGISAEAASLAGHLKLGKLIALYDSNDISLDGKLSHSFSESVQARYEAYGWQVLRVEGENDLEAISQAIAKAKEETEKPTMIEIKTTIGFGSPNLAGSHKIHGAPFGSEEREEVRKAYGWEWEETFYIPKQVIEHLETMKQQGREEEEAWQDLYRRYQKEYPQLAKELDAALSGELPADWDQDLPSYEEDKKGMATRAASGEVLNALAKRMPTLMGGSADLASSNKTELKEQGVFHGDDYTGRNIWFGVREHAMGAALNGMMLHGGVRAFVATFLVFSDYLRPAIRLAALSKLPALFVFTHDSISVGEDGPTHEPVEQIPSLRLIPNLKVFRPADGNETVAAYRFAMTHPEGPVAMALSRQNLPILPGTKEGTQDALKGGYILADTEGEPDVILIATGSEVSVAMEAREKLAAKGTKARVVSMPCRELFYEQSSSYQERVLPQSVKARIAIEAAATMGWERVTGDKGRVIGIDTFGASAPGALVLEKFGFHADNVVKQVEEIVKG